MQLQRPFGQDWRRVAALALMTGAALALHVALGSSDADHPFALRIALTKTLQLLLHGPQPGDPLSAIVWDLRAPRALACLFVGSILGTVGSAFQAIFRNPLAEPYVVGAASGAAIGGAIVQVSGAALALGGLGVPIGAFVTGMLSLGFVLGLARVRGVVDPQRLLIAGVVTSAALSALVVCVLLVAGRDSNQALRWLLGSATPMYWRNIPALAIAAIGGGAILTAQTRRLNAFAMGEDVARRLGVQTDRLKPLALLVGTAMTAIAVGTVGVIGFLGMVAPHIARRIVGVDWRFSLPASAFVGASLMLFADIGAQWIAPGVELPVGVVAALIGAPALLRLLRQPVN